jgi:hypothetical protein
MRSVARALVGTCVCMLSLAGTAIAQDSVASKPARRLLWFGGGLGYGSLSRTCDVCPNVPSEGAVTGYVKVGVAARAVAGGRGSGLVAEECAGHDDYEW